MQVFLESWESACRDQSSHIVCRWQVIAEIKLKLEKAIKEVMVMMMMVRLLMLCCAVWGAHRQLGRHMLVSAS